MGKRIYDKIKKVRDSFSLSQDEFGYKIGVTRQTVSKWELGTAVPSYKHLNKIHSVYGTPLSYLFGGYGVDELDKAIEHEKLKDAAICLNQREFAVANSGVLASSCGVANNSADGLNVNDFVKPKKESKLLGNVLLITAILVLAVLLAIFVVAFISCIRPFGEDETHLVMQINNNLAGLILLGAMVLCILLMVLVILLIKRNKK